MLIGNTCSNCEVTFYVQKCKFDLAKKRNGIGPKCCSKKCTDEYKSKKIRLKCSYCDVDIVKKPRDIKRNKNFFCQQSCAAKFRNKNRVSVYKRSKLEKWIEEELNIRYDFEIKFNTKVEIGRELDIYVPHIKLAFEINGIFHYQPIFGVDRLNKIIENDNKKYFLCSENKIKLCILNISDSKRFNKSKDIKYLNYIIDVIDNEIS